MNAPHSIPRGPVMADVAAYCLTEDEKQRLIDPSIGSSKPLFKKSKHCARPNSSSPSITKVAGYNASSKASPDCPP